MRINFLVMFGRASGLLLALVFFAIVGSGCNTASGFGKDVEKTGESIQEGVD